MIAFYLENEGKKGQQSNERVVSCQSAAIRGTGQHVRLFLRLNYRIL